MWIFDKFRWAYGLLILLIGIQALTLYNQQFSYVFLLLLALVPTIAYIALVRISDVGSKEPRGVVAFHVLIGTLIIYPAILIERTGMKLLLILGLTPNYTYNLNSILFWIFYGGVVVAITEEGLKLGGFAFSSLFHSENNEPSDSVVYAVGISGGFALFENYKYVFQTLVFSYQDAFSVGLARTFTAIPIHLSLGLLMGYYLSKYYSSAEIGIKKEGKNIYLIKAIIIPIILHGIYDIVVFLTYDKTVLTLILAVLLAALYTVFSWIKVKSLRDTYK